MRKLLAIVIIGIFVVSGLATSTAFRSDYIVETKTETISLSAMQLVDTGDYLSIQLAESTSLLMNTGEPVIPKITQVYYLPFQSRSIQVSVDFSQPSTQVLGKRIRPAPQVVIDGKDTTDTLVTPSETVYQSSEIYPASSFTYSTSTGLVGTDHVVLLSVTVYPIRYSPLENTLFVSEEYKITVSYEQPTHPMLFSNTYDLLVIAPDEFAEALQPLLTHKNAMGMNATLITLETLYSQVTEGRDAAENVKLYIKKAVEEQGITYVLLVGGMKREKEQFYLPVRYSNNRAEGDFGVLSDLYFADIYKDNGTAFEDWDSNGNGIFAEFSNTKRDILDGAPDVYVGRLACGSVEEVGIMVEKIINYEKNPADDAWFKRMLLIGGDTYPEIGGPGEYEAELDTNVSASYMTGFEVERLWASTGALTGQKSVEQAINSGAGFIHCAGHANPSILVTFPPLDADKSEKITILGMYNIPPLNAIYALFYQKKGIAGALERLQESWMPQLTNGEKQSVVVIGGCHNSQFNITPQNILSYGFSHAYGYGIHGLKCWSWWLTSKQDGGAIATMGNTGLGMGIGGFDYPTGLDGWLLPRFFYNYGQLGRHHVGEAHSAAITDYVNEFNINKDAEDRQMVEQWILLGDPSLMMGGYQ